MADKRVLNGLTPHYAEETKLFGEWHWCVNRGEKRKVHSSIYNQILKGKRESGWIQVETYIDYATLEYVLCVYGMANKAALMIDKESFILRKRMHYEKTTKDHESLLKWAEEKLQEIYSIFFYV